jgi:hypothetical protein
MSFDETLDMIVASRSAPNNSFATGEEALNYDRVPTELGVEV